MEHTPLWIRPHLHERRAIIRAVYHVRERRFISTWLKHPIPFLLTTLQFIFWGPVSEKSCPINVSSGYIIMNCTRILDQNSRNLCALVSGNMLSKFLVFWICYHLVQQVFSLKSIFSMFLNVFLLLLVKCLQYLCL